MIAAWEHAMTANGLIKGTLGWQKRGVSETPSRPFYSTSPPSPPMMAAATSPQPSAGTRAEIKRYAWMAMIGVLMIVLPMLWLLLQDRGKALPMAGAIPSPSVQKNAENTTTKSLTATSDKTTLLITQTATALQTQTANEIATKTAAELATKTAREVATKVAATKLAMDQQVTATVRAQRTATSEAYVYATQTAEAQRIQDQEEIAHVIEEYGDVKVQSMTYRDPSGLSRILIDPILKRKRQTICWMEKNDVHYTYSDRSVEIEDIIFQSSDEAIVYAWLAEHITYIQRGQVHDWGYDRYKAVYHLRRIGGQWKIDCLTALKDEEPFLPHCEVKFPSTNPCQ
jgi:hypothetical protein